MFDHPAISDLLAAAMLAVALYCVARLALSFSGTRVTERSTDGVHAVMGISMAGMLVPSLSAVPTTVWVVVFSGSALWFGWEVFQDSVAVRRQPFGSHLPHLLMCAAMIYMLVVMDWTGSGHPSGSSSMSMSGLSGHGATWPLLAFALTAILVSDVALNAGVTLHRLAPASSLRVRALTMAQSELDVAVIRGSSGGTHHDEHVAHGDPIRHAHLLAPRSAVLCQLVMCLVMGYMLVTMS
jgi:hypothetical protein